MRDEGGMKEDTAASFRPSSLIPHPFLINWSCGMARRSLTVNGRVIKRIGERRSRSAIYLFSASPRGLSNPNKSPFGLETSRHLDSRT